LTFPSKHSIHMQGAHYSKHLSQVWLAAFKLEFENKEPERARLILAKVSGLPQSACSKLYSYWICVMAC
jgi:hypothetical protein